MFEQLPSPNEGREPTTPGWMQVVWRRPVASGLVLAGLVLVLYTCCLGRMPLLDPDEGRHAEVAREALVTGNWIIPSLNLEPYHHKPMPYYWLVAAGLSVFPHHPEFGARIPSALAAIGTIAFTGLWAGRYFGTAVGLLSATVLATAAGFVVLGRAVLVDMSFTWWVVASQFGFGWLVLKDTASVLWWLPWVSAGFAMMLKGPAALILIVGTMMVFATWSKSWRRLAALRPIAGIGLAVSIAGSWYIAAGIADPAYVWEFLYLHNFERFRSGAPGHPRNLLYYVYTLPAVLLPWSLWWLPIVRVLWNDPRRSDQAVRFCLSWVAVVVGFFSLAKSKLPTYVLPAFPPIAVLTALGIEALGRGVACVSWMQLWGRWVCSSAAFVSAAAVGVGGPVLWFFGEPEIAKALALSIGPGALVLVATTWRARCTGYALQGIAPLAAATSLGLLAFYGLAGPVMGRRYSLRDAAWTIQSWAPTAEIVSFRAGDHSLLFYSGKPVRRVRTAAEAAAALHEGRPVVLLAKHSTLPEICAAVRAPLVVVWQGERNKLVLARPTWVAGSGNGPVGDLTCTGAGN